MYGVTGCGSRLFSEYLLARKKIPNNPSGSLIFFPYAQKSTGGHQSEVGSFPAFP
jgi:hypothetical protein